MTPLEPRGLNGGAGLVAASLVRNMSALKPKLQFTLLTASGSHDMLATLDRDNVRRHLIEAQAAPHAATQLVDRVVPPHLRVRLKRAYRSLQAQGRSAGVTDGLRADLLFCPFTLPRFWRRGVLCVSVVHDLQHLAHPEFFTVEQQLNRQHHVQQAVARSDRVVCVSEFVRQTLVASIPSAAARAVTIPLGLVHPQVTPDFEVVRRLGLQSGTFLLYPANFWPHKNHERLIAAMRIFRARHPESGLRLVCTGAPSERMRSLIDHAPREFVDFAGYLGEGELMALFQDCAALIYPSLYEGFGLPVLEAIAVGKPVACSDLTTLHAVAGDEAIYFDPTSPERIADAIEAVCSIEFRRRGTSRAARVDNGEAMAVGYLDLFEQLLIAADSA